MKSRHSLLNRLMSRFTYSEKFIFISLMFALAILYLSFMMIQQAEREIRFVDSERDGIRYLIPVRKLMEHVPQHKISTHKYLSGDSSLKNEIMTLQSQISEQLKELENISNELNPKITNPDSEFHYGMPKKQVPGEIVRIWENIRSHTFDLTKESNAAFHDELMTNVRELLSYVTDSSQLILDPDLSTHYLMNAFLVRLPEYLEALSQTIFLGEDILINQKFTTDEQARLRSLLTMMQSQIKMLDGFFLKSFRNKDTGFKETLVPPLSSFMEANQTFLKIVDKKLIQPDAISFSPQEFLNDGIAAFSSGFLLWDASLEQFDRQLEQRRSKLKMQEIVGLSIAAFFTLTGFLVGLFIMRQISTPLNRLIEATRRLAGGDLSTRVEIFYMDEIGRVGIAFNNMAQSFQSIIGQLRDLLEAIKRLANGDFSARITVNSSNDEIGQVGMSFNNMSQTFEEIISQLHQLGINLTTSATEIAAASKQQETIIMEQEATTREISVTANEISTTAKEFANTVSEISKVAEHTSALASGGKESLNHMESIMRQMVQASGNIASKLAVLNEKAGNITSVITTITKVADQTNLLSLNAAIEAEKAGEFGRSFAVIAREIRRLADQTAYATLDIEKIVNEIMSAISSSVMGVDDFSQEIRAGVNQTSTVGEQLSKIIEQVQVLTQRFESVNQGMQGQSAGAEQINEAIAQLSQTAQQTTESIHQFRNTIQQLNSAATDLRITVSKIKK